MTKTKILKKLAFLVVAVFLLNSAGSLFGWYELLPWYDDFMHFLGGAWLGLVSVWFFFSFVKKTNQQKRNYISLLTLLFFVFLGTLFWEALEYGMQSLWNNPGLLAQKDDSIRDVLWGLLGGSISITNIFYKIRKNDN